MNHESTEELFSRVDSINNKYSVYKNFSPDELRRILRNIENPYLLLKILNVVLIAILMMYLQ